MTSNETRTISAKARQIYDERLRPQLEASDRGRYVAIEPESGEYFVGSSFDDAVNAAIEKFPGRQTHTIRIGYPAALHLGVLVR